MASARYGSSASGVAPDTRAALAPDFAAQAAVLESAEPPATEPPDAARAHARIPHVEALAGRIAAEFGAQLDRLRVDEVRRGVSLLGPHRDDLRFALGAHALGTFGSRGQQRTAVLALKLAEVTLMRLETGDSPILLLDDILSELDPRRRSFVLQTLLAAAPDVAHPPQVLITTTDWGALDPAFLAGVTRFEVESGTLIPL